MEIEGNRSTGGVFSPGEILTASKLNELANVAGYGKQWHSSGTQIAQGSFGTVSLGSSSDPAAESQYDFPFRVYVMSGSGNEKKVYVRPGTVNNFVPKIGATYLDATTAPSLNFSSISSSGKKLVVIKVTKSGVTFFPNTVEVVLLDNEEALVDTNDYGYLQIASVTCSNAGGNLSVTAVNQYVYASQIVVRAKPGSATALWSFSSR